MIPTEASIRSLGLGLGVVLLLGACAQPNTAPESTITVVAGPAARCSPQQSEPPCGQGPAIGSPYSYQLYIHCGIIWAYFDGRWWKANPMLSGGSGNPPRGWGNPFDDGRMVLMSQDRARFTSAAGLMAEFQPLPSHVQDYPGELCS